MILQNAQNSRSLSEDAFRVIRNHINQRFGILFNDSDRYLVESRLEARIADLSLKNFDAYLDYLAQSTNLSELDTAIELLTNNETYFFREDYQLNAFLNELLPLLRKKKAQHRQLTIWSAGCSSGEEVYSIAIFIAGWFIVMGVRKQTVQNQKAWVFNLAQLILIVWFILAMTGLWSSIQRGLLGIPDMQIEGNMSTNFLLNWTQDRVASELPTPTVMSLHIFFFKGLMLLWALWLAYSLILKWLPWAWSCFSEGGIFKKMGKRKERKVDEEEVMELNESKE